MQEMLCHIYGHKFLYDAHKVDALLQLNSSFYFCMVNSYSTDMNHPQEVVQSVVNYALWSGGHKFESPLLLPLRGRVKKKKKVLTWTFLIPSPLLFSTHPFTFFLFLPLIPLPFFFFFSSLYLCYMQYMVQVFLPK